MDEVKKNPQVPEQPAEQDKAPAETPTSEAKPPEEAKPAKAPEPEYYTLLAKPPKKKDKADVEAAKKIASRYLGIQALEKIVNNKKAKKQKKARAQRFKAPETPEEFYDRAQRYVNGAECAVPFQERALYYQKAADMFTGAGEYQDAPELALRYGNLARETEQDGYERAYQAAMERKQRAQSNDDWFEAARAFERITGYQDADAQAAECQGVLDRRANIKKPLLMLKVGLVFALIIGFIIISRTDRFQYNLARVAHRMGADSVAAAFLSNDNEYEDTGTLLEEIYYDEGVERMANGQYKKALTSLSKCAAYHEDLQQRLDECNYALGEENFAEGHNKIAKDYYKACTYGYKDREIRIDECNYNQALFSLDKNDLQEAMSHFVSANNFGDTAQLRYEPELLLLADAQAGDRVYFASSEYVVLERNGNELTLLSMDFAQDLTYHNSREAVDWASSDLRAALNGKEYLDAEFSQQEQAMLLPQDTGADGDLVTVPSRAEYLRYQLLMGRKNDLWWLRDTGDAPDTAMFVSDEGEVMADGYPVNAHEIRVRPMIRIALPD